MDKSGSLWRASGAKDEEKEKGVIPDKDKPLWGVPYDTQEKEKEKVLKQFNYVLWRVADELRDTILKNLRYEVKVLGEEFRGQTDQAIKDLRTEIERARKYEPLKDAVTYLEKNKDVEGKEIGSLVQLIEEMRATITKGNATIREMNELADRLEPRDAHKDHKPKRDKPVRKPRPRVDDDEASEEENNDEDPEEDF